MTETDTSASNWFDVLRGGWWPLLIGSIVLWLHAPIWKAASQIGVMLGHARHLKMADVSLDMGPNASVVLPPEVGTAIAGLSGSEITRLFAYGPNGLTNCIQPGSEQRFYDDRQLDRILVGRDLASTQQEPGSDKPGAYSECYSVRPTSLALQSEPALVSILLSNLSEKQAATNRQ